VLRQHLGRLALSLRRMGLTVVFTPEVSIEAGQTPYELVYVADNVVVLRNTLVAERRRRTVEVLTMRGAMVEGPAAPDL